MNMEGRIQRTIESLLENETIRQGLDNQSGNELLELGASLAKNIIIQYDDIEDDEAADEAAYPRMRALRKFLRQMTSLVLESDPDRISSLLIQITSAASIFSPETAGKIEFSANFISLMEPGLRIGFIKSVLEKLSTPEE